MEAAPAADYVADTRVCPTDRLGRPLAGKGSTLPAVDDAAVAVALAAVEQALTVTIPVAKKTEAKTEAKTAAADPPGVPESIDDDDTMRFVDFELV